MSVGSIWIPAFAGKVGFLEGYWRLLATHTCPLRAFGAPPPEGEEGNAPFCPLRGRTTMRSMVRWGPAACPTSTLLRRS
ncbi:hypothetical protein CA606_00685 [Caulobacter vibrioides]|uniref:Uncharacterized protein n=1 Tax=Caulobacter vibrioides TaxID=155892 RepID=A0A290MUR0_CAUVI|nr:hypothetical protein CA606_00685 [Caulobacter vibrioides]